ncbi:hypothetical protein J4E91_010503 [Alternaria rosae]|nr:hypothetical protein J4E91_010503 [Alternaria rosae]
MAERSTMRRRKETKKVGNLNKNQTVPVGLDSATISGVSHGPSHAPKRNSNSNQPFTYDRYPFDCTSQIRLLQLTIDVSGQPQWTVAAPISVSANTSRHATNFAALSYEWGESDDLLPLRIDGQTLRIRSNLMHFLSTLPVLRAKKKTLPTLFWIDSICINQDDGKEKPDQIRLLNSVYSRAACVISWLGPNANCSNAALAYVQGVARNEEASLNELLNRRYWTRLWMVQEVVLARRWWVACGVDIVSGDRLTRFVRSTAVPYRHACHWQQSKAWNLIMERNRFRRHGPDSLVQLLLRFCELESKFKIDKIRALLALCPDKNNIKHMHDFLAPFSERPGAFDSRFVVEKMIETVPSIDFYRLSGSEYWYSDEPVEKDWRWASEKMQDIILGRFKGYELRHCARSTEFALDINRLLF